MSGLFRLMRLVYAHLIILLSGILLKNASNWHFEEFRCWHAFHSIHRMNIPTECLRHMKMIGVITLVGCDAACAISRVETQIPLSLSLNKHSAKWFRSASDARSDNTIWVLLARAQHTRIHISLNNIAFLSLCQFVLFSLRSPVVWGGDDGDGCVMCLPTHSLPMYVCTNEMSWVNILFSRNENSEIFPASAFAFKETENRAISICLYYFVQTHGVMLPASVAVAVAAYLNQYVQHHNDPAVCQSAVWVFRVKSIFESVCFNCEPVYAHFWFKRCSLVYT